MPTGYTCDIEKGQSFNDFVMGCAKAFGACVTMRDDPKDKEIPEFKVTDYHSKALDEAVSKAAKLVSMSLDDAIDCAVDEYNKECESRKESIEKSGRMVEAHNAMLKKVNAWKPPTTDHAEMKVFMLDQITKGRDFDDMSRYYAKNPLKQLTGAEWLAKERNAAKRDIEYHTAEHIKETERVNSRNKWVCALKASLTPTPKKGE